jgi:osmotically-inducible protein OsmY
MAQDNFYQRRGHLPPPFYNAKDEKVSRLQYPSEAPLLARGGADPGNYGTGGYYGNTYGQEQRGRAQISDSANRDSYYRHLGDRRWADDRDDSWQRERAARQGYSPSEERLHIANTNQGKGPRSYRRPDQRIQEDLNDRLYDDRYLDASDIETEVRNGDVVLSGTVEDRQSKRLAEHIAETISGVANVENRLRTRTRA